MIVYRPSERVSHEYPIVQRKGKNLTNELPANSEIYCLFNVIYSIFGQEFANIHTCYIISKRKRVFWSHLVTNIPILLDGDLTLMLRED